MGRLSLQLMRRVPLPGEIQWANVSTTQIKKPGTCARNTKCISVRGVSFAVILAVTVKTDPHA